MTDQKEQTKPLTLSTTTRSGAAAKGASDATQVRQKFSHGRTRTVTVEVKKPVKRPPGSSTPAAAAPAPAAEAKAPAAPTARTLKLGGGPAAARPAPTAAPC
jgi:translation initiation factor IF-2